MANQDAFSRASAASLVIASVDTGTKTSLQIDSAWVYETSGEAVVLVFTSPVAQTNATFTAYFYCTAITGSPTFKVEVRNSATGAGDPDRPEAGGAVLGTTSDVVPVAARWSTFTISSLTLAAGAAYFVVLFNSHASPTTNHATFTHRGSLDSFSGGATNFFAIFKTGTTADGIATDPSFNAGACAVIKFSDGSLVGNPYVDSAAHANNSNDRGVRISFPYDVWVSGFGALFAVSTNISGFEINDSAGNNVVTVASDPYAESRGQTARFASVRLTANTLYDFVVTFAANATTGTVYSMGETSGNLPADVLACRPPNHAYVDGATPGSYTVDTTSTMLFYVVIDTLPAATSNMMVHPGMLGGMRG